MALRQEELQEACRTESVRLRWSTKTRRDGPRQSHMSSHCWEWTGATANKGYGKMIVQGHFVGSHVVAWYLGGGRLLQTGEGVLHKCDWPACQRPNHLYAGTAKDNIRDCVRRGRHVAPRLRGEKHGRAKISDSDRKDIARRRRNGERLWAIAVDYGITDVRVAQIAKEKSK